MLAKYISMTPLDKPLKRAVRINGRDYVITLNPAALKITEKGRRLGLELKWAEIVSGETALAVALRASLGKFQNASKAVASKSTETPKPSPRTQASTSPHRFTKKRAPMKRARVR
jgi:hypothetical protein